jgi:hypothetical protein
MSAAKKDNRPPPHLPAAAILRPIVRFAVRRRSLIAAGLVVAAFVFGGLVLWNRVRNDVLARAEYALDARTIQITSPPAWIRADVKAEALRGGSLDTRLSLLDDDLAERLAKAFALHPWVARVERVEKHYPSRVTIELSYRKPTAMVEVPGGLFPVDQQGVLLPSADFSPAEARKYPRLVGIESEPLGPVGSPWGDRFVTDGVKIAIALAAVWEDLHLQSIRRVSSGTKSTGPETLRYELLTKNGTAIPWGSAPGSETATEPRAAEKVARLSKYLADEPGLEEAARRSELDLRMPTQTRTAERSGHTAS